MPYRDAPSRPRLSRLGAAVLAAMLPLGARGPVDAPDLPVGGQKSNPPGPTPSAATSAPYTAFGVTPAAGVT